MMKLQEIPLINELIKEYNQIKNSFILSDFEKTIISGGIFVEIVLRSILIYYNVQNIDFRKSKFDKMFNTLINLQKLSAKDEILTLVVPIVAKSIYTLRSKKKVAHFKEIDPNFIDAKYVIEASDWIFSQLLLFMEKINEHKMKEVLDKFVERKLPVVEKFEDGSILILKENLPFSDELLLLLYINYPKRVKKDEIIFSVKPKYPQLLSTTLRRLERKKFIHINKNGIKLTKLGIIRVEKIIKKVSASLQ